MSEELIAWKNTMPVPPHLHVRGGKTVQAPSLQHRLVGTHVADSPTEPDVYQISAKLVTSSIVVMPVVFPVSLEPFDDVNFQGGYTEVKCTYPDGSTEIAPIQIAQ